MICIAAVLPNYNIIADLVRFKARSNYQIKATLHQEHHNIEQMIVNKSVICFVCLFVCCHRNTFISSPSVYMHGGLASLHSFKCYSET